MSSGKPNDGKVDFNSTIAGINTGGDGTADTLTIETGGGNVVLGGTIGAADGAHLDGLTINTTATDANYDAALSIPAIGTHGTRAGVRGVTSIGNANSGDVTLSAAGYQFQDGQTTITSGGHIVTAADANITSNDNIKLDPGSGSLKFTGDFDIVSTLNKTVEIAGNSLAVDGGGEGTVDTLTITSGQGNGATNGTITIGGTIGSAELKTVTLTAATAINLGGDITTGAIAGGNVTVSGPAVLTADVTVDADAANTSITFGTINDDGADGTASNLNLTTNGGAIQTGIIGGTQAVGTIDINASGGAGNVTLAGIGTSDSGSVTLQLEVQEQ